MISSLVGLILGALAQLVTDWLRDKRSEKTLQEKGALEAARETDDVIKDVADKQAANNAAGRPPDAIAEWLRREADSAEGRGGR